jgi:hypothetical protein
MHVNKIPSRGSSPNIAFLAQQMEHLHRFFRAIGKPYFSVIFLHKVKVFVWTIDRYLYTPTRHPTLQRHLCSGQVIVNCNIEKMTENVLPSICQKIIM